MDPKIAGRKKKPQDNFPLPVLQWLLMVHSSIPSQRRLLLRASSTGWPCFHLSLPPSSSSIFSTCKGTVCLFSWETLHPLQVTPSVIVQGQKHFHFFSLVSFSLCTYSWTKPQLLELKSVRFKPNATHLQDIIFSQKTACGTETPPDLEFMNKLLKCKSKSHFCITCRANKI